MLSLGLVSSFPALGNSRDLRCESCSAQNLMHCFCPYYKLFLLMSLRLYLGEEQRLFSVFRTSKVLFRSVSERNLLFACLESVEENIQGVKRVSLFLWKTCSRKFKYRKEKQPNVALLAMVELGVLIAVQKWEHSSAARTERHRRTKGKTKTCPEAMGETWMGAGVGPGRAERFCKL